MKEERTIKVIAYRDPLNRPTCACNFETGEVCEFYRVQRFGTWETCALAEENERGLGKMLMRRHSIERNIPRDGSLIPIEECPIWKGEKLE